MCSTQGVGQLFHSNCIHQGFSGRGFPSTHVSLHMLTFKTENLTPACGAPPLCNCEHFLIDSQRKVWKKTCKTYSQGFSPGFGFGAEPHRGLEEGQTYILVKIHTQTWRIFFFKFSFISIPFYSLEVTTFNGLVDVFLDPFMYIL